MRRIGLNNVPLVTRAQLAIYLSLGLLFLTVKAMGLGR